MLSVLIVLGFLLSVVLVPVLVVLGTPLSILAICAAVGLGYVIFKDSMNLVQSVCGVYWIIRDNGTPATPRVSKGFMRQYTAPWLFGSGMQFRMHRWTVQVGTCRPSPAGDEAEGILKAVDGHYMEESPKEIGVWT
jgi:hypothetical protein